MPALTIFISLSLNPILFLASGLVGKEMLEDFLSLIEIGERIRLSETEDLDFVAKVFGEG